MDPAEIITKGGWHFVWTAYRYHDNPTGRYRAYSVCLGSFGLKEDAESVRDAFNAPETT